MSESFSDFQILMSLDSDNVLKQIYLREIQCTSFELNGKFPPDDLPPAQNDRIRSQHAFGAPKLFCAKENDLRTILIRNLFLKADDCLQYIFEMSLGVSGVYSKVDEAFSETIGGDLIEVSRKILNFYV